MIRTIPRTAGAAKESFSPCRRSLFVFARKAFFPGVVFRKFLFVATVAGLGLALTAMPLAGTQEQKENQEPSGKPQDEKTRLADQMPEGEGKDLVVSRCTVCHDLSRIVEGHRDAESWGRLVEYMLAVGADLSPEEAKTVVKYLGASFPPLININKATVEELSALPSVDTKLAGAIVRYRNENGSFATVDDVAKVKGLSPEAFRKIKSRITTGLTTTSNPPGATNNNTTDNSNNTKEKK